MFNVSLWYDKIYAFYSMLHYRYVKTFHNFGTKMNSLQLLLIAVHKENCVNNGRNTGNSR